MTRIPIYRPMLGEEEKKNLVDCVDREWLTGGKYVKEFEQRIVGICGVKHAVACSNGTTALYLGLLAMGIGKGDEVIVPDFTFIASANAVTWTGAKPIFCDVDKTLNIDIKLIEKCITAKTKAIMPVHIYGLACDMDGISVLAQKYGLKVIGDACQGIGVNYKGKPVSSFGDVNAMSFYADKTITSGEGGMVLTNDESVAKKCLILKHQGRTGRGWYIHDEIGYNFRMTDMQAAIGVAQLGKLDMIVSLKRQHDILYRRLLNWAEMTEYNAESVPFRHNIFVENPDSLIKYLDAHNVEAKRVFYPLHRQPCYNVGGNFPNTEYAYEHGVSLPSSPLLKSTEINYICDKIKDFYR